MAQQSDSNTAPAGWFEDPEGVHQYRFWDGTAWTDHVADDGQQSLAPLAAGTTPGDELKRREAEVVAELSEVEEKISRAANSSNDADLASILIADVEERMRGGGGTRAESPILRRAALQDELESIQRQLAEAGQNTEMPEFTTVEGIVSPAEAVDILFERALPATPDVTTEEARRTYEFVRGAWGSQGLYSGTPDEMRQLILTNLQRMQAEDGFRSFSIEVKADENHLRAMVVVFFAGSFQPVGVYRCGGTILACGNFAFSGPSVPVPPA
jgi:hypothetical protein